MVRKPSTKVIYLPKDTLRYFMIGKAEHVLYQQQYQQRNNLHAVLTKEKASSVYLSLCDSVPAGGFVCIPA